MNTEIIDIVKDYENSVKLARTLIESGEIFAFPTETVYGIGCRIDKADSIEKIYKIKGRSFDKPLSIHISSFDQLDELDITIPNWFIDKAKSFMPGPITVIVPKPESFNYHRVGSLETIGIRYPDNEFFMDIIDKDELPILATSANISGSISPKSADDVYRELKGKIRYIFDYGFSKYKMDSTVITIIGKKIEILRQGAVSRDILGI